MHSSMQDKILHKLVCRLRKYKTQQKRRYFEARIFYFLPPLKKKTFFQSKSYHVLKPIYFLEADVKLHINNKATTCLIKEL